MNNKIAAALIIIGAGIFLYCTVITVRCSPNTTNFIQGCLTFTGHPFILTSIIGLVVVALGVFLIKPH